MQTIRRQAGSRAKVCATRGPLFSYVLYMCTTENRNRYWPSRLHHVGWSLFAAAMCRKLATAAAFSWHFTWHFSGICRITKALQRLIAEVAERRESGAFFYEVTLPSRMLIPSFANSKTEGTFPEELALRGSPATLPRSRGAMRPSCARVARPKQRARGKPGARRTRGRAWCVVSTRVSHHRFTGSIRLSP